MKINSKELKNKIQKNLDSIYIFFAEESVQLSSLIDQLVLAAKNSKFEEKKYLCSFERHGLVFSRF